MKHLSLNNFIFLITAIILSSCTSLNEGINEHFGESFAQPAQKLDSSPDSTGILAVEVSYSNTHSVTSITLLKIDPVSSVKEKPIYAAPANTPKPSRSFSSVLSNKDFAPTITIFSGLEPAEYLIKSIASYGVDSKGWYSPHLLVDIQKGKVNYAGIDITIDQPFFGQATFSHTITSDSIREINVWKKVQVTFPESPWISIIEDKINVLEN